MIDDRTTHLSLPLPSVDNYINDDVVRLREAITAIDNALALFSSVLSTGDASLDSMLELGAAINANRDAIKRVETNIMLGIY